MIGLRNNLTNSDDSKQYWSVRSKWTAYGL